MRRNPTSGRLQHAARRIEEAMLVKDTPALRKLIAAASLGALFHALEHLVECRNDDVLRLVLHECVGRKEQRVVELAQRWAARERPLQRLVAAKALGSFGQHRVIEQLSLVGARVLGRAPIAQGVTIDGKLNERANTLLGSLAEDEVPEVALAALEAIGDRNDLAESINIFKSLTSGAHADASVRVSYVRQTYGSPYVSLWLESEKDVRALLRFLKDPDAGVRAAASCCVGSVLSFTQHEFKVDRADIRTALFTCARHPNASLFQRGHAIVVLATFGDRAVIPLIATALSDAMALTIEMHYQASHIISAAQQMPHPSYIPALKHFNKTIVSAERWSGETYDRLITACRKAKP